MESLDELYVEVYSCSTSIFSAPLETLITLFTYKICNDPNIKLKIVKTLAKHTQNEYLIDISYFKCEFCEEKSISYLAGSCTLPVVITDNNTVIAGLCGVCRQIVKTAVTLNNTEIISGLLGFRNACLMSPNEASVWTKFCEIDIIATVKQILCVDLSNVNSFTIPVDVARFERHMAQPIRVHNVYKLARDRAKLMRKTEIPDGSKEPCAIAESIAKIDLQAKPIRISKKRHFRTKSSESEISSCTPIEDLNLEHKYAEGVELTIADVILFPCFHIIFSKINCSTISNYLSLSLKWYKMLLGEHNNLMKNCLLFLDLEQSTCQCNNILLPDVGNYSLYKSDPKRYKPQKRIFTKQEDIDKALDIISTVEMQVEHLQHPPGFELLFNWDDFPYDALPEGGHLPQFRLQRKTEQLENLAKAVMQIVKDGDTIVDFCSGSGHLGIVLAVKLPLCHIVLLENKEESLTRAKNRVNKLKITNVSFFQCNLDFFKADFQVGTSLHACGVATDLVIQHCIERKANFVCCPCCYGSVHDCHHLTYPRSNLLRGSILIRDYLVIGHGADQTHDENHPKTAQGDFCMDIIDNDRALQAAEHGYKVTLSKLKPRSCTPKNNLLVGTI